MLTNTCKQEKASKLILLKDSKRCAITTTYPPYIKMRQPFKLENQLLVKL